MLDLTQLKTGKLEPRIDPRTLAMHDYLVPIKPAPRVLNADKVKSNLMLGNDLYGCCVKAMEAHGTRRFEKSETGHIPSITARQVEVDYWKEQGWTGKPTTPAPNSQYDNGLVELTSLNRWRSVGCRFSADLYTIFAHGNVDWTDEQELANTIFYLNGCFCGVALPVSAQKQTGKGLVWDIDDTPAGSPGSWGLHGIYLPPHYDLDSGLWYCITWGFEQAMTTPFVRKYFDESHGVVDNRDCAKSSVDCEGLEKILEEITGG